MFVIINFGKRYHNKLQNKILFFKYYSSLVRLNLVRKTDPQESH